MTEFAAHIVLLTLALAWTFYLVVWLLAYTGTVFRTYNWDVLWYVTAGQAVIFGALWAGVVATR
jgi:hypothetical protein